MLAASAWIVCSTALFKLVKSKQCNYRPGEVLVVPGGWGSQISRLLAHEGGKPVSPLHWPLLTPGNISGTHFCYRLNWPQCLSVTDLAGNTDNITCSYTILICIFFFFFLSVSFLFYGCCTFLTLTNNGVAISLLTLTWLQDQLIKPLDKHKVCLPQHIPNISCAVGCTSRIDSTHHSQTIPLSCRNSVNINLPIMQKYGRILISNQYLELKIIHQIGLW
jgi:hypothetical protein